MLNEKEITLFKDFLRSKKIAEKFEKNCGDLLNFLYQNYSTNDFKFIFVDAFAWADTKENFDFWQNIHNEWLIYYEENYGKN